EGVAYKLLKVGASSRPPALRMATPVAVPLVRSSNLDCSQERVPSANAVEIGPEPQMYVRKKAVRRKKKGFRALCNFIPLGIVVGKLQGYNGEEMGGCRCGRVVRPTEADFPWYC